MGVPKSSVRPPTPATRLKAGWKLEEDPFPEGLAAWTPTLELEAGNMGEEGGRL